MKEYEINGTKFKVWKEEKELIIKVFNPETGNFENKKSKTYWQEVNGVKESISESDYVEKLKNVKQEKKEEEEVRPKAKKSGKKKK